MLGWIESDMLRLCMALIGSALISFFAYKFQALSITGAMAAFLMGVSFVFFGEPIWFTLLLTFFVSSSFWSKFKKHVKNKLLIEQLYEKTGSRDAMQVLANGGLGMLLCIVNYFFPSDWLLFSFIGIMAAVNADTWATEIGGLSQSMPRSIINGKQVPNGTSGGISMLGSAAAIAGALFIGLVAFAVLQQNGLIIIIATLSGTIGAFIDSFLGATVQRMHQCVKCGKWTETRTHCHLKTVHRRGVHWMNNDAVNMLSSIGAGVVAILLSLYMK